MYQNYYFHVDLVFKTNKELPGYFDEYEIAAGLECEIPQKKNYFNVPLNGNEIKNYVMEAIEEMNIAFMFNTKPIPFYVDVMIYRSVEYVGVLSAERDARNNNTLVETRRNLIPVSLPSANTMNKKQILNF